LYLPESKVVQVGEIRNKPGVVEKIDMVLIIGKLFNA